MKRSLQLWPLAFLLAGAGCQESGLHVGRILEFSVAAREWERAPGDMTAVWSMTREADQTDGMHTYSDFLEVSKGLELEAIWLERVLVMPQGDAADGAELRLAAKLGDDEPLSLAVWTEGRPGAEAELTDVAGSGLFDHSTRFASSDFAFVFTFEGGERPAEIAVDVNVASQAHRTIF